MLAGVDLHSDRCASIAKNEISTELRKSLPAQLPAFLAKQRWFGGKARQISSTGTVDVVSFDIVLANAVLLIVQVGYADGGEETYSLPLLRIPADSAMDLKDALSVPADSTSLNPGFALTDALANEQFSTLLLPMILRRSEFVGEKGTLRAHQTEAFADLCAWRDKLASTGDINSAALKPRLLIGEQSNTSVIYGERLILKFFRRLEEGTNPELEIGIFLTEKAHFKNTPQTAGWLEYRADGKYTAQAILQTFVPNQGDGWRYTLRAVSNFYGVAANHAAEKVVGLSALDFPQANPRLPEFARACVAPYLEMVGLLGKRTAELHLALASEVENPSFAPEPFTGEFQGRLEKAVLQLTSSIFRLLREKHASLPSEWRDRAQAVAAREHEITQRFQFLLSEPIHAVRIRIHGDYHLGQVLYTGSDFVIIDFEGEPARPLAERRTKQSPLQDVAGMLRSLHYAVHAPRLGVGTENANAHTHFRSVAAWAERWYSWVSSRFLNEYLATSREAGYLPSSPSEVKRLLEMYLLQKAIYELGYELNNRPAWIGIPLAGISTILSRKAHESD
jgi:trehalose synthase-fused probable maltokinase